MFAFLKRVEPAPDGPRVLATMTPEELKNILEQERLTNDALKTAKMLASALNTTMQGLATKYKLPKEFELDRSTGNILVKENTTDG